MSLPKEIIEIKNFLNLCKYDEIIKDEYLNYRSSYLIEKENKCICFDASIYAYLKLEKLNLKLNPYILSLRGIGRDKNNSKYMKAHSVCIFYYNKKYGAIGKHESDFREPIYTSYEQIALTFSEFLYIKYNLWLIDYVVEKISEYKPNDYENSQELIPENTIYKTIKRKNQIDTKTIQDYLIKIKHFDENEVNSLLRFIQTGKK